jgi:hydroxymethylbilane synthase
MDVRSMHKITVGTRESILALAQTGIIVKRLMETYPEFEFDVKRIKTSGDANQTLSLSDISIKNFFVKEIESELLAGSIDLAVHSMKDMPSELPDGLSMGSIPERDDNRDVLISSGDRKLSALREGAVIGTSSLRRRMQIGLMRPDLTIRELRGNIHTRLAKLDSGDYDAIVLAAAGLKRTGLSERAAMYFDVDELTPAPCQGALCIETRTDDNFINNVVSSINDPGIFTAVMAEREFSMYFGGGCKTPVGASARFVDGRIELTGFVYENDRPARMKVTGEKSDYMECAKRLATDIRRLIHG